MRSLLEDGLVDEFQLWMCPIVLGSGKRLFPEGAEAMRMELLETKTRNGVVSLGFRPGLDRVSSGLVAGRRGKEHVQVGPVLRDRALSPDREPPE